MSRWRAVLLVAVGAFAAALLPGPAWAGPPRLVIAGVQTEPGIVHFVMTARDLPETAGLDPAQVRVSVGGTVLRSDVKPAPAATGLPPRGVLAVLDATAANSATALSAAKAALGAYAAGLPPDVRLGLVTVTASAKLELAPTSDRAAFTKALSGVALAGFGALASGATAALDALAAGGFGDGDRRVLLVSAGAQSNAGLTEGAQQEALSGRSVPVDVLGIAATTLGSARLRGYTDATHGRAVLASDGPGAATGARSLAASFAPVFAVTAFVPNQVAETTSTLEVTVAGLSGSSLVRFGAALPGPRTQPAGGPFGWIPSWTVYVLAAIVFLALGGVVLTVAWPQSATTARIRQIEHFGPARAVPAPRTEPAGSPGGVLARTALAATASVVRSGGMDERIALRLERAGMKLRPHEWVLIRVLVTLGMGIALFLLVDWIGAILGLVLGWLATLLYQMVRIDRRATLFAEQLPDALQLVIGSLKSGFSLPQALESLVRESPDPVAAEFGRALAEHRLGADVSDALERIAQRTGSDDLGWAVMAVRIQREVGGNLAEVLQTTVDTMRERGRLRRHVRSLSAEGRLSAWVLIGLPIALGLFMFFYRRQYMTPLFTDPLGLTMLLAGSVLFVIGIIWMTRVIKVEA